MDCAFFSDEIIDALEERGVRFTVSAPFERLAALKEQINQRAVAPPEPDPELLRVALETPVLE